MTDPKDDPFTTGEAGDEGPGQPDAPELEDDDVTPEDEE